MLWSLLRDNYAHLGKDVWQIVPNDVTTHVASSRAFARLAQAWRRDLGSDGPLHVLELCAGAGRFANGFLRWFRPGAVRYSMTDGAASNLQAAAAHPALVEHAKNGVLTFAPLDLTAPALPGEIPAGAPLVVIATYAFAVVPHDFFRVTSGVLEEGLVTLTTRGERPAPESFHDAVRAIDMRFDFAPVARPRFAEPAVEAVLTRAAARADSTALFPTAPLRTLDCLRRAHQGPMLVLVADKAWVRADAPMRPSFALDGLLSSMTSFVALEDWAKVEGGAALLSPPRGSALDYAVIRLDDLVDAPELEAAFGDFIVDGSPEDRRTITVAGKAPPSAGLSWFWAALRVTGCDPRAVAACAPAIRAQALHATYADRVELEEVLTRAAGAFFVQGEREPFLAAAVRLLLAFELRPRIAVILADAVRLYGLDLSDVVRAAEASEASLVAADRTIAMSPPALADQAATLHDAQALLMQLQLARGR